MSIASTPATEIVNTDVLAMMPPALKHVVEVGCGSGSLAGAYRAHNPDTLYTGLEVMPEYIKLAKRYCNNVYLANIESLDIDVWKKISNADCWIFADVLEHLYDPWAVLSTIKQAMPNDGCLIACIPNLQHWHIQQSINSGAFIYRDSGLLDRTHIRWFTRLTMLEMWSRCGFNIVEATARKFHFGGEDVGLAAVRAMSVASGMTDIQVNQCVEDAKVFQYVFKVTPN
jgi:2-polyprenyl-3-methyl-5-hydroxy-6-metoxy-1,4-benzoquinol methylase